MNSALESPAHPMTLGSNQHIRLAESRIILTRMGTACHLRPFHYATPPYHLEGYVDGGTQVNNR